MHSELDYSPEVLRQKSREVAAALGYPTRPVDSNLRVQERASLVPYLRTLPEPRKWDEWLASEAPVVSKYRESPAALVAEPSGDVTDTNPPQLALVMASVMLDGRGLLIEFSAIPYNASEALIPPVEP